ncbi:MAG: type II toxin-antitoxin system Phd/YefM family antitoxin [Sphingorhabdus sp.]|uniref:type II toxin-antitoxin system Phd/YefM family antitoxin n=1 Tax=Sphingorhabdus sp. TaxID=1902408 RepID=UPI0038FBFD72
MIHEIFANAGVSISDLKKNPSAIIAAAEGQPIAILNRNTPAAYIVPAKAWKAIVEQIEDMELAQIVRQRQNQSGIPVKIEDLLNLEDI